MVILMINIEEFSFKLSSVNVNITKLELLHLREMVQGGKNNSNSVMSHFDLKQKNMSLHELIFVAVYSNTHL